MERTGAHALFEALQRAGVDTIFGYPGGAMLPGYDALVAAPLRHVLARHEQGAGHMAEGYAQASGRLGVVVATSGPGGTNLITPLADAYLDSVPLLAITGQVATRGLGREAFQEADIVSIATPVTKHAAAVMTPDEIPQAVAEAVHVATLGRPGPVLLDIPKDVLARPTSARPVDVAAPPGHRVRTRGSARMVQPAADVLRRARRPVLYVGGGVLKSGASKELLQLAELLDLPVVTTLMGRGAFPDSHPNHLGMPGMHGLWPATTAMQRCDLLVALGARFDDRVTGDLASFAPEAAVVHVDIDPVEIGKNRKADIPIVGDCRTVLGQLLDAIAAGPPTAQEPATGEWWSLLRSWQREHPLHWEQRWDGPLKPQAVVRELDELLGGRGIVVTGVGQHQMWAAQHVRRDRPRTWITSGGLGTMGFCLPAAIGAKLACPEETVVGIDGDGSFQMTLQELATARANRVPVVIFVLNNQGLGMVRQWQRLFHDGRYSHVDLDRELPCLLRLAEAYGCVGLRCTEPDDLAGVLDKALSQQDVPVLVDVWVDPDEEVFPMVPAGGSNDDVVEFAAQLEGRRS